MKNRVSPAEPDEIEVILSRLTELKEVFSQEGFKEDKDKEGVWNFVILLIRREFPKLRYYTSNEHFGKWYRLANSLLYRNCIVDYLSSVEITQVGTCLEHLLLSVLSSNEDSSQYRFRNYVFGLVEVLECFKLDHRLTHLFRKGDRNSVLSELQMANPEGYWDSLLESRFVESCCNKDVYDFYLKGIETRIYPTLEKSNFLEVVSKRTAKGLSLNKLEVMFDVSLLEKQDLERLVTSKGVTSPSVIKACIKKGVKLPPEIQRSVELVRVGMFVDSINSVEEAVRIYPLVSPIIQSEIYSKFGKYGEEGCVQLMDIPILIPRFNLLLLKSGYTELGLLGRPGSLKILER